MRGFLSDSGAELLKKVLQEHYARTGPIDKTVLPLVLAISAGWNWHSLGRVKRTYEPVKLTREVAYEVLTGKNYWRNQHSISVEMLFECISLEELWKRAEELTNGYIKR